MTGPPAQPDEFAALVAAKIRDAVRTTQHHQAEGRRRDGALRARLEQLADEVERRFLAAARAGDGDQLETESVGERAGGRGTRHLRLTWRRPAPARSLEVAVNPAELRLEYAWSAPARGSTWYAVDVARLDAFEAPALVFQLIEPDPWLDGAVPPPLPGARPR
jgi:hypothetical protein